MTILEVVSGYYLMMDSPMRLDRWGGCEDRLVMRTWLSGLLSGTNATDVLAGVSFMRTYYVSYMFHALHPPGVYDPDPKLMWFELYSSGWVNTIRKTGWLLSRSRTYNHNRVVHWVFFVYAFDFPSHLFFWYPHTAFCSGLCTRRRAGGEWRLVIWRSG